MTRIIELFGIPTNSQRNDWGQIVDEQVCPFTEKRCYKTRKSNPDISIGTCTVLFGKPPKPFVICPIRLAAYRDVFTDCLHLLTGHQDYDELYIVREVSLPGGTIDYCLVSVRNKKVQDFVGIEIQTVDTTGTVWSERQKFLQKKGVLGIDESIENKSYGINWKMTAKTALLQLYHKINNFEILEKKLVIVMQDELLEYMKKEFNLERLRDTATIDDSLHFHIYRVEDNNGSLVVSLKSKLSTDSRGLAACLSSRAKAKELEHVIDYLQSKIQHAKRLQIE